MEGKQYISKYNSKENVFDHAAAAGGFKKKAYQYSIDEGSLVNQYNC